VSIGKTITSGWDQFVEAAVNVNVARCSMSAVTKPGMEHDLHSRCGGQIRVIKTHMLLHCLFYIGFVCYKQYLVPLGVTRSLPRQDELVFILRNYKLMKL